MKIAGTSRQKLDKQLRKIRNALLTQKDKVHREIENERELHDKLVQTLTELREKLPG